MCSTKSHSGRVGVRFLTVAAVILAFSLAAFSQRSNELFSGSYDSIPVGPSASSQTARLLMNINNGWGNDVVMTNSVVNVTASLSNQQYTGVDTGAGNPVVMFGGASAIDSSAPGSVETFRPMGASGSPANLYFSNVPYEGPAGIDIWSNSAFSMFTSVRQWAGMASPSTDSSVFVADLTLNFSSPVSNPRLQLSGLGDAAGTLGFSTELELLNPGLTFTRVEGNNSLWVTPTYISNSSETLHDDCTMNLGVCGTVQVNGTNITSITLRVFVRGDGGASDWGSTIDHAGDAWMIGVSIPESFGLTGTVFNDADGQGTIDGNGIDTADGQQLWATLADPTDDSVIGSFPVFPGGLYYFDGLPSGVDYEVEISTVPGTVLENCPPRVLPVGWMNIGEHVGSWAGNDGSADGVLQATVSSGDLMEANFGVHFGPTSAQVDVAGRAFLPDGRAASRTQVVLINASTNEVHATMTSQFGYFRFKEIEVGNFYIISAGDKRVGSSDPKMFMLMDTVEGMEIQILPPPERPTAKKAAQAASLATKSKK